MAAFSDRDDGIPVGTWRWRPVERDLWRDGTTLPLTALERELVSYLAERAGQTVSRSELLTEVWGYAARVRSRAVVNAVARLRSKLGPDAGCVVNVYGRGYRLVVPHDPDLVGREADLAIAREHLARHREVTLHGMGGVGKTRLAHALVRDQPSPVWVSVAGARSLDALTAPVAAALGLQAPDPTPEDLQLAMRECGPLLLVLDEAEGVIEIARSRIEDWLAAVATLRVLVTSRVLYDAEPHVFLGPLEPEAAATLFERRAHRVRPHVGLHRDEVLEVVEALDRLPLAIELAAARMRVLDLPTLRDRLRDDPRVLADRRRSLGTTLEVSWELLSTDEQRVLAAACAFPGPFAFAAVESVAGIPALDALDSLARAALVVADGPRWTVLELVRQFVRGQPCVLPAGAFAAWAAAQARTWVVAAREGDLSAIDALVDAMPDLQAASTGSPTAEDAAHLALGLALASHHTGARRAAIHCLDTVPLEFLDSPLARDVQLTLAELAFLDRRPDVPALAAEMLRQARSSDDRRAEARAWHLVCAEERIRGDLQQACESVRALTRFADEHPLPHRLHAMLLRERATCCLEAGFLDEAHDVAIRALSLVEPQDLGPRSYVLRTLAQVYHARGEFDAAVALLDAPYEAAREAGGDPAHRIGIAFAAALRDAGHPDAASEILEREAKRAARLGHASAALMARLNLANDIDDHVKAERAQLEVAAIATRLGRTDLHATAMINVGLRRHLHDGPTRAVDAYQRAARAFEGRDQLLWVLAQAWRATALFELGHPQQARELLARVGRPEGLAGQLVELVHAAFDGDWQAWRSHAEPPVRPLLEETILLTGRLRTGGDPPAS